MTLPSLPSLLRTLLATIFATLLVALLLALSALRAGAQAPDDAERAPPSEVARATSANEDPSGSRATSFRAVDGAITEDVPGGMMLVGAYGVIALLLLLFLLRQQAQLRELDKRIGSLRSEIERSASQTGNQRT